MGGELVALPSRAPGRQSRESAPSSLASPGRGTASSQLPSSSSSPYPTPAHAAARRCRSPSPSARPKLSGFGAKLRFTPQPSPAPSWSRRREGHAAPPALKILPTGFRRRDSPPQNRIFQPRSAAFAGTRVPVPRRAPPRVRDLKSRRIWGSARPR